MSDRPAFRYHHPKRHDGLVPSGAWPSEVAAELRNADRRSYASASRARSKLRSIKRNLVELVFMSGVSSATLIAPIHAATVNPAPPAFAICSACHGTEPGKTRIGPSLAGVAGRKAASLDGFAYSTALRTSGLVWEAASLDRFIAGPSATVPGTRMAFAGVKDAQRRREIIDYLLTLKN